MLIQKQFRLIFETQITIFKKKNLSGFYATIQSPCNQNLEHQKGHKGESSHLIRVL